MEELADTTTAAPGDEIPTLGASDLFVVGSRYYRVLFLFHSSALGKDGLLGAAIVANDVRQPTRSSSKVLDAVADQLQRGLQRTLVERSSTTG